MELKKAFRLFKIDQSKDYTETSIRKKYHRLALKHHPDKGGDRTYFQEIQEAYELLSVWVVMKQEGYTNSFSDYESYTRTSAAETTNKSDEYFNNSTVETIQYIARFIQTLSNYTAKQKLERSANNSRGNLSERLRMFLKNTLSFFSKAQLVILIQFLQTQCNIDSSLLETIILYIRHESNNNNNNNNKNDENDKNKHSEETTPDTSDSKLEDIVSDPKYDNTPQLESKTDTQAKSVSTTNMKIISIKCSLHDLLMSNVYCLEYSNKQFMVPMWHDELVYEDSSGNEFGVNCEPNIENGFIDENNDVHIYIESSVRKLFKNEGIRIVLTETIEEWVESSQLTMEKYQHITLERPGISKINTDDIYDESEKGSIIIHIRLVDNDL